MADLYGLELSGLDPEYVAELRKLSKQEKMAEELAKRGMQPLQGQMVGGVYVRPSIFQGLSNMAQSWVAKGEQDKVEEGYRSLGDKRKAENDSERQKIIDAMQGTPEILMPSEDMGGGPGRPAVPASRQNIMNTMLQSRIPEFRKAAIPMMQSGFEQQEFRDALKGATGGGQLTGFEPMQNGVPGQQGMVGDPQKLIQDIAMNPDMSNEDKQAAIAQIRQQSAGASGGQVDPRALLLSGNPKAMQVGQFLEGQQGRIDLAKQKAQDALEKQRQHDQVMGALGGGKEHPPVAVIGPDGKPVFTTRGDAIGKTPAATDPESKAAVFTAKENAKKVLKLPQARLRTESIKQNLDKLEEAMIALHANPDLTNITGTIFGRTPNITNMATGAQTDLDSIKSQIFQSSIQAMREASKTGGAVGNVSDREGDKLERTLAGLDQSAGTEKFKENLMKAVRQVRLSKELIQNAFDEEYREISGGGAAEGPPTVVDW